VGAYEQLLHGSPSVDWTEAILSAGS
jgi:hypothetical protein